MGFRGLKVLGLRVSGSWYGVEGLGFRLQGLRLIGFRTQDLGTTCEVEALGFSCTSKGSRKVLYRVL